MRKLLASTLFLLPAAALAAPPAPGTPAAPTVSVTTPASTLTVHVPSITVKVHQVDSGSTGAAFALSGTVAVPAKVSNLDLQLRVGQLHVRTADTDHIQVKVRAVQGGPEGHFIFQWTTGKSNGSQEAGGLPKDLHLVTEHHGDTVTLCVRAEKGAQACRHSGAESINGWKADWQLVVPARMHLALDGGVISGKIRGVAGGVKANVGVGSLDLVLPNGPVTARVGVGKLDVRVKSREYGQVHLATGVGDTSFHVGGRRIKAGYHHEFTSSNQDTTGSGSTDYDLKAGTGHVSLKLGAGAGGNE